ncbi:MAG TPA: hypothetical protein ENN21_00785 [Spirochaetes bacterium]|nr:hypothetical protein [Spirochaetota bacterium]
MESSRDIVLFSEEEESIIGAILETLGGLGKNEVVETISNNRTALRELAGSISLYPSILEKHQLGSYSRSVESLIESLCQGIVPDMILHIPTKAILGRGFSIAKINFLMMLRYVVQDHSELGPWERRLLSRISQNVFTLTAEEVYQTLIEDITVPRHVRYNAAYLLAHTWEYRLGYGVPEFAPILLALWRARSKLIPHFGTMLGFSELFTISDQIEPSWFDFLERDDLSDDEILALEEFIFGITHEEIVALRKTMQEQNKSSLSREEIERYIGAEVYPDYDTGDPRELYRSFRGRKTHARYRARAHVEGPKKTMEEYLMGFLLSVPETLPRFGSTGGSD